MIPGTRAAKRNYRRRRWRTRGRTGPLATIVLVLGVLSAIGIAIFGVWNGGFDVVGTHSAWRDLVREYEADSEPVYFENVIPPDLPADQNFFAGPVFEPILPDALPPGPVPGLLARAINPGRNLQVSALLTAAAQSPGGASLEAIANMLMAAGLTNPKTDYLLPGDRVLAALRELGLDFTPLIATADRDGSRFPIAYGTSLSPDLPHLPYLEALGDWLAIKVIAQISVGNTDPAAIDTLLIWRLAASVSAEPFLKSQQTRRKLLGLFASCIRVGIQRGAWTADQLTAFADALAHNRTLTDLAWALRGQRAQLNSVVHDALSDRKPAASPEVTVWLGDDVAALDMRALRARQVAANRALQHLVNSLAGPEPLDPATLSPPAEIAENLPPTARENLTRLIAEAALFAQIQVLLSQAETAVALERYRLESREFPADLAELEAEFLATIPIDPLTAEPLIYERLTPTSYTLTSPGWPPTDDADPTPWLWTRQAD